MQFPNFLLHSAISLRPDSDQIDLKKMLLVCLDFLFLAIDTKIDVIVSDFLRRFCTSNSITNANKQQFFRLFRLDLGNDEQAGMQTLVGTV